MKLLNKLKEKKGFTLIESMVSIAILAIATTVFAVFMATTTQMTTYTLQNEKDYQILQEAIAKRNNADDSGNLDIDGTTIKIISGGETNNPITITIDSNTTIELNGKYVVVSNPKTNQFYTILVPSSQKVTVTESNKGSTDGGNTGGENANP